MSHTTTDTGAFLVGVCIATGAIATVTTVAAIAAGRAIAIWAFGSKK